MKAVFVVGFYGPVKKAIESLYAEHLKDKSIVWVGQKSAGREANLSELAGLYAERVKAGVECTLVLVAKVKGRDFVLDAVAQIIATAARGSEYRLVPLAAEHAGDREIVLQHIADFGLPAPSSLSLGRLRSKAPAGKILCVSLDGNTSVLDALRRAGFPESIVHECFHEERIAGARLSGLIEDLGSLAKQYRYMLYAFLGLRTLTPEVKAKFDRCYEAPTAAKVAELARKWMEGD